ncbi:MAG TPA: hypothetical protein VNX68_19635 [Nitrosopumilaceae archaeon]|jgi:hypothetical protein|nr:hypothetical protein [Nitrosopumilaceae archaeon]
MAYEKRILLKKLEPPSWLSVDVIPKGTEVEVKRSEGETYFVVKHPDLDDRTIAAEKSHFIKPTNISNVKIGDEFWFLSLTNKKLWKDKAIKITSKHIHFERHLAFPEGNCRADLNEWSITDGFIHAEIEVLKARLQDEFQNHYRTFTWRESVLLSKNKKDLLQKQVDWLQQEKRDLEYSIDLLAQQHAEKITDYAKIEDQEASLLEEIKQS